jgi:hypothetical protein
MHTQLGSYDREKVIVPIAMFPALQKGISTGKPKTYTIQGSKYCTKDECNTVITTPKRHKHSSSSANRSSDIAMTVNINTEFHLMAVSPIIECVSRDLTPEY